VKPLTRRAAWRMALGISMSLCGLSCAANQDESMPAVASVGTVPVVRAAMPLPSIAFGCQEGEDERSVTLSVRLRADGTPRDVWLTADSELQGDSLEACYRSNLMGWTWIPAENALGEPVPYVWTETFSIVS